MYNQNNGYGPGSWRDKHFSQYAPVNISENDSQYAVQLYAPGLVKEHFAITIQSDILHIRYNGDEQRGHRFVRREYRAEEIDRAFDLKGKVNAEAISAKYADGILTVELPKR